MVCTNLLTLTDRISFKSNANTIGTSSPSTIFQNAMMMVFCKALLKPGRLNTKRKFSSPHHFWSPNSPLLGMKSWKAITSPPMGT